MTPPPSNPVQSTEADTAPAERRGTYTLIKVTELASLKARIQELTAGLEKVRSYNVDIAAGRINYRPHDHIQVIDEALQPRDTTP